MKQCPVCKTTYTDITLRYCLSDGAGLVDPPDEQSTIVTHTIVSPVAETVVMDHGAPVRVDIPQQNDNTRPPVYQPAAAPAGRSAGGLFKILIVVGVLGILLLLGLGAAGFVYYAMSGGGDRVANSVNDNEKVRVNKATPVPSPTKDELGDLRDQINDLEKALSEQSKNNKGANVPDTLPGLSPGPAKTARVNSPGDGFLALRTLPSSESGSRVIQIPHGAAIGIGGCLPPGKNGGKTGRWCRANYNGFSGWVFDAYLIY